jgi:hypothetical protein
MSATRSLFENKIPLESNTEIGASASLETHRHVMNSGSLTMVPVKLLLPPVRKLFLAVNITTSVDYRYLLLNNKVNVKNISGN